MLSMAPVSSDTPSSSPVLECRRGAIAWAGASKLGRERGSCWHASDVAAATARSESGGCGACHGLLPGALPGLLGGQPRPCPGHTSAPTASWPRSQAARQCPALLPSGCCEASVGPAAAGQATGASTASRNSSRATRQRASAAARATARAAWGLPAKRPEAKAPRTSATPRKPRPSTSSCPKSSSASRRSSSGGCSVSAPGIVDTTCPRHQPRPAMRAGAMDRGGAATGRGP
mmetsp:Transcript_26079/g.82507  ORF Transcript_26079/g.82507 Transcript_26079/m.82507 type:complete len:232 (-) Transcript_26079:17-712(-)